MRFGFCVPHMVLLVWVRVESVAQIKLVQPEVGVEPLRASSSDCSGG